MNPKTKSYILTGLAGALFGLIFMWMLLTPPMQAVIP